MDPNNQASQPQSVTTTQPMTHPGLPPESPMGYPPKKGFKRWLVIVATLALLVLAGAGVYIGTR